MLGNFGDTKEATRDEAAGMYSFMLRSRLDSVVVEVISGFALDCTYDVNGTEWAPIIEFDGLNDDP